MAGRVGKRGRPLACPKGMWMLVGSEQISDQKSVLYINFFSDYSGNNVRIIGHHSRILGQFRENRGIEL